MMTDTITDTVTNTATDTITDTAKKRVIPRSDDNITRIDVRIPNSLFEEVEQLAIERGEPVHHKSGRVTMAPTLLDLIRIGLDHYSPEALERVSAKLAANQSDTASDNRIDLEALEDRLLVKLGEKLQSLAEELAQKK
ncbi:hypothetical protein [Planktothrix sp.]|uniref:hypothetical protein n=1 Tax=Planktothrix sp. TaxID=3088171 RepID=UPI0038D3DA9C